MARIKVKMNKLDTTLNKAFKEFIISKTAQGIKEETLKSYNRHFTIFLGAVNLSPKDFSEKLHSFIQLFADYRHK